MANFEIPENPEYMNDVRKFEPTDPAHADLFNAVTQTLLNNDEFLRQVVEQYKMELQSSLSQQQEELTQYTDTKVSELVGSAPEKLDTLEEVAEALQKNDDVVTALTEAIGTKQGKLGIGTFTKNIDILGEGGLPQTSSICWCQSTVVSGTLPYESSNTYWFLLKTDVVLDNSTIRNQKAIVWEAGKTSTLERLFTNGKWFAWKKCLPVDGDLKDTTVSFTSGDDLNPTGWTAIGKIFSGAKLKDMLNGFSTGIKNLRFLYKLIGTTDISKIGDGTLTGIVSALNTDKESRKWMHSTVSFMNCTKTDDLHGIEKFLDAVVKKEAYGKPASSNKFETIIGSTGGVLYCALTLIYSENYYGGFAFTYGSSTAQFFYVNGQYSVRLF